MRRMGVLIAALTLGLSATLSGCGSDEGSTENASNANQQSQEKSEGDAAAEEASASGSDEDYCELLRTAQSDLSEITKGVDPKQSEGALEEVSKKVTEISDAAPSEIQEQWATMADTMDQSIAALEELDKAMKDPKNADQKQLQQLSADMQKAAADAQKASDAVVADTKERCGFALQTG